MLGHVMILCFFIFFIFGTISVQLWSGVLRHRCFFPESIDRPSFMPPFYEKVQEDFVCSTSPYGIFHCHDIPEIEQHDGSMCYGFFDHDPVLLEVCKNWVANYTACLPMGPNPSRGTVSFDHIGYASIAIFQVISLEGWSEVMYLIQDSYSFWVWTYFIALVLLGSYLAVNLCLVVIAAQFSVTKAREKIRIRRERFEQARLQGLSATSLDLSSNIGSSVGEGSGLYLQILNLVVHFCRLGYHWVKEKVRKKSAATGLASQAPPSSVSSGGSKVVTKSSTLCEKCRLAPASSYRPLEKPLDVKQVSFELEQLSLVNRCQLCGDPLNRSISSRTNSVEPGDDEAIATPVIVNRTLNWTTVEKIRRFPHTSRAWLKRALDSQITLLTLQMLILINAVIMACEHHDQPPELTHLVELVNTICTFVFFIELLVKAYSYGLEEFVQEGFNVLDAVIIMINLVELLSSGHGSGFAVLRLFRLVRIVKIVRFLPALQHQLLIMIHTVDNVATFFFLLLFFLFISALLGMSLFGCKFCTLFSNPMAATNAGTGPNNGMLVTTPGNCHYLVKQLEEEPLDNATTSTDTENLTENALQLYECPVANFDNLGQALFTVLQIFTQDDWGTIMKNAMHSTSDIASLYFIALVTLGNYIIFNLLVAILVEGFSSKSEEAIIKAANKSGGAAKQNALSNHPSFERSHNTERKTSYLPGCFRRILRCCSDTKKLAVTCWDGGGIDYSFFIFKSGNVIRAHLTAVFSSQIYETTLLLFVILSCLLIALENPKIAKNSWERYLLTSANYFVSAAFLCECIGKSIAFGFLLGHSSYLRSGWNILDFFLITIAVVDVMLDLLDPSATSRQLLQILRVLRLLRALRPLRMISKARGLKIVIETLAESIKPIGNIILICCFFFCIFAILGVQLFRGCYARCVPAKNVPVGNASFGQNFTRETYAKWAMETISQLSTKDECSSYGLEWETESYNFDSLPEALMALFVFSTLDGWADITRNGVSCVGVNQQPIPNNNPWNFLYFAAFLLIVCFFALNMFVGVVVNNFQKVQRRFEELESATSQNKNNTDSQRMLKRIYRRVSVAAFKKVQHFAVCLRDEEANNDRRRTLVKQKAVQNTTFAFLMRQDRVDGERLPFWMSYPPWRLKLYGFVTHNYFELVMTAATTINVVSMAVEFYNMPYLLSITIKLMGLIFLGLIVAETLLKFVALGFRRYWQDKWNRLDLIILLSSLAAVVLEEVNTDQMPINPSIIRIARIFRIARVIKLWRAATGVRKLLKTVSAAIPQVGNLSVLFLLLFFIYASLGVELYGRFDCKYGECEGISRHANFRHFGTALLTLFRIFTGDDWNGILKDILRMTSSEDMCSASSEHSHNSQQETQGISCHIIHSLSPFYFVSFVLLAQFVLINVVVAVLMRQIEDAHKEPGVDEQGDETQDVDRKNAHKKDGEGIKETCFIDGGEIPSRMSNVQMDMYNDDYLVMKLREIAQGVDDDGGDIDEQGNISCVTPRDDAPHHNLHQGRPTRVTCVVVVNEDASAMLNDDDCSGSCTESGHNSDDTVAETCRAMDSQLIKRLSRFSKSSECQSTGTMSAINE